MVKLGESWPCLLVRILLGAFLSSEIRMLFSSWYREGTFSMRVVWPILGKKGEGKVRVTLLLLVSQTLSISFIWGQCVLIPIKGKEGK